MKTLFLLTLVLSSSAFSMTELSDNDLREESVSEVREENLSSEQILFVIRQHEKEIERHRLMLQELESKKLGN